MPYSLTSEITPKTHNEQRINMLNKGRPVTEPRGAILELEAKGKISNLDADTELAPLGPTYLLSVSP